LNKWWHQNGTQSRFGLLKNVSQKQCLMHIYSVCAAVNNVFLYILLICDMFLQNELYDKKQIELVTPLERRCKNYGHISNTAKVIGR